MIISITGPPGSGKSTVGKILMERLNLKRYYMGDIMRSVAKEKGMSLEELGKICETDETVDKEIDQYQEKLGKTQDDFVVEGRTSYFFIPHSIKVFIDVDIDVAAKRIFNQKSRVDRAEKNYGSIDELKESIKTRMSCERLRYEKYYGIKDCYDKSQFDLVIDSTNLSPDEIVDKIIAFAKKNN